MTQHIRMRKNCLEKFT